MRRGEREAPVGPDSATVHVYSGKVAPEPDGPGNAVVAGSACTRCGRPKDAPEHELPAPSSTDEEVAKLTEERRQRRLAKKRRGMGLPSAAHVPRGGGGNGGVA